MKTLFIVIDHGLALGYYFQTNLTQLLVEAGLRLVFIVKDSMLNNAQKQYNHDNVFFEPLRDTKILQYQSETLPGIQELLDYVRKASASSKIPLTYVDTHRQRKEFEAKGRRKIILKTLRPLIFILRISKFARSVFRWFMSIMYSTKIYNDYFDKYKPDLILSDTAGWRLDRYILREANRKKINTGTYIIGWDNPSSQGLPGAFVDYALVWSSIHKWELNKGVDWPEEKIFVVGMPLYDGYISEKWKINKDEYYKMHKLDNKKKLIAFAATALSISPNLHIIEQLIEIVEKNLLQEPTQLLIRLHPNHFKPMKHYQEECRKILELARSHNNVIVVEPVEVAEGLERYSGDDFPEKASMLSYCDVLVTIYSTMVVEASLHDKPIISVCIDSSEGWKENFWIPLHEVPFWPTAKRINLANAGKTVFNKEELINSLNEYLINPGLERKERYYFVENELTYLKGGSTSVTFQTIMKLIGED